jgi:hypothetical protein
MRKALIAASVAGAALFALAQTRPSIGQIRGPVVADGKLLGLINGRLATVGFGAGVQLVQAGSGYELRAAPQPISEMRLSRSATGTWTFPAACPAPVVYRNGLRQWPGLDYAIDQGAVRFSDSQGDPSEPDDVVIAECH